MERRRRSSPPPPLTEADRALLGFAAEHRFVVPAQAAVVLRCTETDAARRLRTLGDRGYLRRQAVLRAPASPVADLITAAGLRAIGSDLEPPQRLTAATYDHDLALGWLTLAAHGGRFGPVRRVVAERRMRSEDKRAEPGVAERHGVRRGGIGADGHDRLHYPDMVLVAESGHRIAFELELGGKGRRRDAILAAYAADRRIDAVVYLVQTPQLAAAVRQSAERTGISDLVHVQRVDLGDGASAAPARGRAAGRGPRRGTDRGAER